MSDTCLLQVAIFVVNFVVLFSGFCLSARALLRMRKLVALLFDFAMQRHLVELRAEFHELKSFRIISSILGGGVSRHAGCSLFRS